MTRVPSFSLTRLRHALGSHQHRRVPVEGVMKKAAVAAVLREEPSLELLFIRRAEHPRDPWSGHMAFPGGRMDPEDHGPLSAARRETREELGLDLDHHGELFGELSHVPAMAHGKPLPMVVVPFVFGLRETPPLVPDASEVQEALWVPFDFLADAKNRRTMDRTIAGVPMKLPCYHFEGRVIWGLTLRMLDELLQIAGAR